MDNRSSSTVAPVAAPVTPAWSVTDWVARFEAVGGFITPNNVGWRIAGWSESDHRAARRIYGEIEHDDERGDQVRAFAQSEEQVTRYLRSFEGEA